MSKTNAVWHRENPLPNNATLEERMDWHKRHAENCGCRPMPASIRKKLGSERQPGRTSRSAPQ